jgi:hypothetical protein
MKYSLSASRESNLIENVFERARHDPSQLGGGRFPLHRPRFSGTSLSVRKDGSIIPLEHTLNQRCSGCFIDLCLGGTNNNNKKKSDKAFCKNLSS